MLFGSKQTLGSNQAIDSILSTTTKGFTSHEELAQVNLIHMNGRIYDAKTSQFLNADIVVQKPTNTQNTNRYSYTLNNPLKYVDNSGYLWKAVVAGIENVERGPLMALSEKFFNQRKEIYM
jgi:RHS repeat-associated protein